MGKIIISLLLLISSLSVKGLNYSLIPELYIRIDGVCRLVRTSVSL